MDNYKLKRLFKKILFFLIITIILWFIKLSFVNAETFDNTNYMRWTLTSSSGITMNSGQTPFYTSYLNKDFPNAKLYFHYTNYTFYSDYFYDITYTYYFDNKTNNHDFVYAMFVSNCNIYIEGVGGNQYSDGCEILEKDETHLKIRTTNLKINGSGPVTLELFSQNDNISGNTDIMHVQMNSYLLEITAKSDTSISSSQFESGINDITNKQNETNNKLDDLNKNITDESSPNLGGLNDSAGWLKPGPVDSIINLPLSLLNNLQTNLGNTCNPVTVKLPYVNKDISLPCISAIYKQINGLDTWFQGIGVIAAAFILYRYFMYLYNRIDDTLSFRENNMQGYFDDSLWGGM